MKSRNSFYTHMHKHKKFGHRTAEDQKKNESNEEMVMSADEDQSKQFAEEEDTDQDVEQNVDQGSEKENP